MTPQDYHISACGMSVMFTQDMAQSGLGLACFGHFDVDSGTDLTLFLLLISKLVMQYICMIMTLHYTLLTVGLIFSNVCELLFSRKLCSVDI